MRTPPSDFSKRAQLAQEQLVARYIDDPDVTMIDIGYEPEKERKNENIVLRIHVRERWMKAQKEKRTAFPMEVDGIPVVVIPGEYRLE